MRLASPAPSEAPGLSETTGFQINPAYNYLYGEDGFSWFTVLAILFIILLACYLIIYNIFNISVKNDILTYGLLKNVGASGKQLKRLMRMQACRIVERVSPVEALRMSRSTQTHKKVKRNFPVSWWGMALQNLLGSWRKGLIVMFSIAISLVHPELQLHSGTGI